MNKAASAGRVTFSAVATSCPFDRKSGHIGYLGLDVYEEDEALLLEGLSSHVIQDDVFNRSRVHTVIVCALTSNLHRATEPGNVLLDAGEGNLPRQSVLVVSQISSVLRKDLGEYVGTLSAERVEQVLDGMRFQQASFFGR